MSENIYHSGGERIRRGVAPERLDGPKRRLPHCCKQDLMHVCTAADSNDRQRTCHFYLQSTGNCKCMEIRFEEFCSNQILHKYLRGAISDDRASNLIKGEKGRLASINNRAEGYHLNFPLEGEETLDDVNRIWNELVALDILEGHFWVDKQGTSGTEYGSFSVTWNQIKDGTWSPKRKELLKDIMRYMEIRDRLGT